MDQCEPSRGEAMNACLSCSANFALLRVSSFDLPWGTQKYVLRSGSRPRARQAL